MRMFDKGNKVKTKKEKNPYILTLKESRAILRSNLAEMKKYE